MKNMTDMEKESYIPPEMEIITFENEDIITLSGYEGDETPNVPNLQQRIDTRSN